MQMPPCRSSAALGSLAVLGLGIALSACIPAVEQTNEENAAEGQLATTATPQKPSLDRWVVTPSSSSRELGFNCDSGSSCTMEVVVAFEGEVLRRAARTAATGGSRPLLTLKLAGGNLPAFALVASFGIDDVGSNRVAATYRVRNLPPGQYVGVLTRVADLPAELDVMPTKMVCVGGEWACSRYVDGTVPSRAGALRGSLTRWTPIDIELGSGSYSGVGYEDVQLLKPLGDPGKFYAPRVAQSDADGEYVFDDVAPGEYTLRIAGTDRRITVGPGAEQREDLILE